MPRSTDPQPPRVTHPSHSGARANPSAGLRPLRRLAAWFGREKPTLADQITAGIVVTVVGGLILAGIIFVIHVIVSGDSKVSGRKAHGPAARHSSSNHTTTAVSGQIVGGDQALRFADLTRRTQFANPQHARACDVVEYRVGLYNSGPSNLSDARVAGAINTITPYRTIEPTVSVYTPDGINGLTAFQGKIYLAAARTETHIAGSTQLVNSAGRVVKRSSAGQLEDRITATGRGIPIGAVTVGTTEYIQFRARVNCGASRPPRSFPRERRTNLRLSLFCDAGDHGGLPEIPSRRMARRNVGQRGGVGERTRLTMSPRGKPELSPFPFDVCGTQGASAGRRYKGSDVLVDTPVSLRKRHGATSRPSHRRDKAIARPAQASERKQSC